MNSFDRPANKDGSRTYKCYEYTNKISSNLLHLKRDGRFCDIELISGNARIKVCLFEFSFKTLKYKIN